MSLKLLLAHKLRVGASSVNLRGGGDPYGTRTRVAGVKGQCPNH